MTNLILLQLLKKYAKETIEGGGAVAGKNCVINDITEITGGNRVEFGWTLDDGTEKTQKMDVMNGADGQDGAPGADGSDGAPGQDGADGKSAYEVAVDEGYTGTEEEWLASLKGDTGDPGPGVPDGGTTGQILRKKSDDDHDTEWGDPDDPELPTLPEEDGTYTLQLVIVEGEATLSWVSAE